MRLRLLSALIFVASFTPLLLSAPTDSSPAKKPKNKHLDIVEVPDVPGLPRVLLLGDSISGGYTLPVRARLRGRANLHRCLENAKSTRRGLERLDVWLGQGHWDVIHFNFGLHDLRYNDAKGNYADPSVGKLLTTLDQYRTNLHTIVARLKRTGAKLIFATSTPVPAHILGRIEGSEVEYNRVALEVMKEEGVPIDDLWTYVHERQARIQLPNDVHFSPEGYEEVADVVTASIVSALP